MTNFMLSPQQISDFDRDGYIVVKSLFQPQEVDKLYKVAVEDDVISKNSYDVKDGAGKRSKLALWFTPGEDLYGLLTRSNRLVASVARLLDGSAPVCHFHSKLMQKEPQV